MMNPRLESLKEQSERMALAPDERLSLRESLLSYIDKNPVKNIPVEEPVRSSFFKRSFVFVLVLIVVFAGGGISYAAQRSLPGDTLYPVKVKINEPVRSFFAFSDKNRAEVDADIASDRLSEAETLNKQSRLSPAVKAQIVANFSEHIQSWNNHMSKLAQNKDYANLESGEARLETTINSHAQILPALSLVGNTGEKDSSSVTPSGTSSTTDSDASMNNSSKGVKASAKSTPVPSKALKTTVKAKAH